MSFSTWHLLQSDDVQTVWLPMLDELKSRTNGSINYTLYAGGSLGSGPEHFDNGCINGMVTCPTNLLSYKLYEVAGCAALETFGCVGEGLFMNQDSWNRTPDSRTLPGCGQRTWR